MNQLQRILAGLLAAQLVIIALVFWPRQSAPAASSLLIPGLTADQVTRLIISDDTGQEVTLENTGGAWVLPDAGNYPADAAKITAMLDKLATVVSGRLVTQTSASHARLKVADDDFTRRIYLELSDGSQQIVFLGTSAGAGATHIRQGGRSEVYLTGEIASTDASARASGWIDTAFAHLDPAQVIGLMVENANGMFEFRKDETGAWVYSGLAEGESLDTSKVTSLVNGLTALTMSAPLGTEEKPEYGFASPTAVITLVTQGESDQTQLNTLEIGALDGSDYIVRAFISPYIVKIASISLRQVLDLTAETLLLPKPTATPGQ